LRKDGELIHVSLTISPIKDASGKIVGASKIARDITRTKQLERQLQQSQKMDAVGQLTGGIAHDFNNLLGVVIGNLDLLERLIPGNDPALGRLRTAQKAAARGADLTRRLLAFSSAGELKPTPVPLQHAARNILEMAVRVIGPEIRIATNFDRNLPPVLMDASGFESALLNLVVNARDAMPKGGTLTITTQMSDVPDTYPPVQAGELKAGSYACVSVSDTGHGMPRDVLERAFEPFFSTKPRNRGTGLGLAMVYGFAKQSGGTARIYSEVGVGTTVSIYLPLAVADMQSMAAEEPKAVLPTRGGTALVVDDEPDLLEVAAIYLCDLGYEALQAKDGAAALKIIELRQDIELMITDVIMPGGMNGVELAHKVRLLRPGIRIVYSSGFPAGALEERSMLLLDGPLLRKPYSFAEFRSTLSQAIEAPSAIPKKIT
jgi:signal transduction histidine kinase